jgi:hypothetical protein
MRLDDSNSENMLHHIYDRSGRALRDGQKQSQLKNFEVKEDEE